MKYKIFSAGLFILSGLIAYGQQSNKKGRMEVSVGASIPVGEFASANVGSFYTMKGAAKTGESLMIAYDFASKGNVSISVILFGQRNPLNTRSLEEEFSNTPFYGLVIVPVPNPPTYPGRYHKNWQFSDEAWYAASLMVGGYAHIPIKRWNHISFNPRVAVGAVHAWSPEYRGASVSDTSQVLVVQSGNNGLGFSYGLSMGINYAVDKAIAFKSTLGYFGSANVNFKDMKTNTAEVRGTDPINTSYEYTTSTRDIKQSISTINVTLGLTFTL